MSGSGLSRRDLDALVDGVEGWLSLDEAWALHSAVRAKLAEKPSPLAVELGSWKGRSTVALGSAFAAAGRGALRAVDPHAGTRSHARAAVPDTFEDVRRALASAGVEGHVQVVRTTSREARAGFAPESVDLLFIDASHRREDVTADLLGWMPLLAAGVCAAKGWGCRFWLAIKSPKGSEGVPKVEAETEGVAVMEGTWVCVPLSRSTISASSGSATLVG